jgi:hypothetical protein
LLLRVGDMAGREFISSAEEDEHLRADGNRNKPQAGLSFFSLRWRPLISCYPAGVAKTITGFPRLDPEELIELHAGSR